MKERLEIIFSGVGGQGLLLIGELLGSAASIIEKRQAVMTSAYGTEARGTFTKADLILSDSYIDFPEVLSADVVIALAPVAYERYAPNMRKDSILIYNSDKVTEAVSPAQQHGVPTETLAVSAGSFSSQNMVALGALLKLTGCAHVDSVKEMIRRRFTGKDHLIEINISALEAGYTQQY